MNTTWHLGRFADIEVRLHWTFLLLPVWIYFSSLAAGSGAVAATATVAFVLAIFVCVLLHEYGHALTARRFGIATRDITLLPIGGVASLQRMPRVPWQELAIAIAGPAVNVVIAAALFLVQPLLAQTPWVSPALVSVLAQLAWVNVALVVFNMLPAFPMDGGRVLRAVLALGLPYTTATRVAAGVGQVAALALGLLGLLTGNLILAIVAGFIFLAARSEASAAEAVLEPFEVVPGTNQNASPLLEREKSLPAVSSGQPAARSVALPIVSAQWNAGNVLGWLRNDTIDEFLVSSHGVVFAAVRKCDLRRVVQAGQGALPIESLLTRHFLPFRELNSSAAS